MSLASCLVGCNTEFNLFYFIFSESNHLNSIIDVTRVNIFSIATQYKAVFTDDEVITRQNDLKNSIFHSWLNYRVCI